MANSFVHIELQTQSTRQSKEFYGALFDWQLEDTPMGDGSNGSYTMIKVGDGVGGGMMKHTEPGAPSMWIPYVSVDDVPASVAKARSLGAEIVCDTFEVPDCGWFGIIKDPAGAVIGFWKDKK